MSDEVNFSSSSQKVSDFQPDVQNTSEHTDLESQSQSIDNIDKEESLEESIDITVKTTEEVEDGNIKGVSNSSKKTGPEVDLKDIQRITSIEIEQDGNNTSALSGIRFIKQRTKKINQKCTVKKVSSLVKKHTLTQTKSLLLQ